MTNTIDVAVVGATGLVGETMIEILESRDFPVGRLYPLASERSLGRKVGFRGEELDVGDLAAFDFSKAGLALFSAGASVSERYAPQAADAGCVVVDNTSRFRYEDDVPLVVTEVNPEAIGDYSKRRIVANPNCSTMQMLVALKPIHDAAGVERINVATYQAVSGAGRAAIEALASDSAAMLNGRPPQAPKKDEMPRVAFNAVPHIDAFQDNGYTKEEMKLVWETRKILGDERIGVNATAVRIPVFYGHSEAVNVETREKITAAGVRELLAAAPGVQLVDATAPGGYPTAAREGGGSDPVYVGRIREDASHPRAVNLWIVSDNVRKGAALNSVQIAEILVKNYL